MPGTEYDTDTRAQVMAALLAGQAVSVVARQYKIPPSTVYRWREESPEYANRPDIGELLLDYLQHNLAALSAQAVVFSDPKWLRRQEASHGAVLHGVMLDKAVRLLEALDPAAAGGAFDSAPEPVRRLHA